MIKDLWIYAFRAPLTKDQLKKVEEEVSGFVLNWKSHGREVPGEYFYKYDQFFFLHNTNPLSGCSIDGLTNVFKGIKSRYQLDALRDLFFYRSREGKIVSVEKYDLKKKIQVGEIDLNSIVFNNDINTKADFFEKPWESTLNKNWVFLKYQNLFHPMKN